MRGSVQPHAPRRRFRREPAEKRARIIAAARACFAEHSYEATTTAEIARQADVSEGTIFHHFGTKLELLRQVAAQYGEELAEAMYAGADGSFARLDQILENAERFLREEGGLGMEPKRGGNPQRLLVVHGSVRKAIIDRGAKLLDAWQARGLIRPMNAQLAAEILFPILDSMLVIVLADGAKRLSREYLDEAMRCFEGACSFQPREH